MIQFKSKILIDPKPVTDATERAALRVLPKFGAFVRRAMKKSIKQAPKSKLVPIEGTLKRRRVKTTAAEQIAQPGLPPYAHKGNTLSRFILFAVDRVKKSVVIGAQKLPGKIGDAPHALEKGGVSAALRGVKREVRTTRVRAHPFAGPALAAELPKLAGMFKDQIRK